MPYGSLAYVLCQHAPPNPARACCLATVFLYSYLTDSSVHKGLRANRCEHTHRTSVVVAILLVGCGPGAHRLSCPATDAHYTTHVVEQAQLSLHNMCS